MTRSVTRWRNLKTILPLPCRRTRALHERRDDAGARAPGDVKTRHGIARGRSHCSRRAPPSRPRGKNRMPRSTQPGALFARRESDIALRPLARPKILRAVESGGSHPVGQREFMAVADAQAPLLGRIRRETARRATRTPGRRARLPAPDRAADTVLPASASSLAATSPASPAPMTIASADSAMAFPLGI